jgi:quinol-cytochrome oxidoreductase complex cytochrome b subunit
MNTKLPAVILVVVGFLLIIAGSQRRDSLAGASESMGDKIATKVDGEPRFPAHTLYLVSGVILVVAGGITALRGGKSA